MVRITGTRVLAGTMVEWGEGVVHRPSPWAIEGCPFRAGAPIGIRVKKTPGYDVRLRILLEASPHEIDCDH